MFGILTFSYNGAFNWALAEMYKKYSVCTKIRLFKIQNQKFFLGRGPPSPEVRPTPARSLELGIPRVLVSGNDPWVWVLAWDHKCMMALSSRYNSARTITQSFNDIGNHASWRLCSCHIHSGGHRDYHQQQQICRLPHLKRCFHHNSLAEVLASHESTKWNHNRRRFRWTRQKFY